MIMIANLQYAWTLFVKPMQTATGWKASDIQWAFTLFILFQTWVQPAQGFLIDRLGPRLFITAAGVMCGVGWAGLGQVTTLPMLYGDRRPARHGQRGPDRGVVGHPRRRARRRDLVQRHGAVLFG